MSENWYQKRKKEKFEEGEIIHTEIKPTIIFKKRKFYERDSETTEPKHESDNGSSSD